MAIKDTPTTTTTRMARRVNGASRMALRVLMVETSPTVLYGVATADIHRISEEVVHLEIHLQRNRSMSAKYHLKMQFPLQLQIESFLIQYRSSPSTLQSALVVETVKLCLPWIMSEISVMLIV